MFEKSCDLNKSIERPEKIGESVEPQKIEKKIELSPEADQETGLVCTKKEVEEERKKKLLDPTRRRDLR